MSYVPSRRQPVRPAIDYEDHPVFSTRPRWRNESHRIIFGNLTPAGRLFDLLLIGVIVASVVVVMLESVQDFDVRALGLLWTLEWVFTVLFTIEYVFGSSPRSEHEDMLVPSSGSSTCSRSCPTSWGC